MDMEQFLCMSKVSLETVGGLGNLFVMLIGEEMFLMTQETTNGLPKILMCPALVTR